MRILLISDLHLDFFDCYSAERFIKSFRANKADVVAFAGDLSGYEFLKDAIKILCEHFAEIIFVPGNHEFYMAPTKESVFELLENAQIKFPNFKFLYNSIYKKGKIRFLGTTLWFPETPQSLHNTFRINDFNYINDFENWVYDENDLAMKFLNQNLQRGDFVITHHLPSWKSVDYQYKDSTINCYYVCNIEDAAFKRKPRIWQHGHSHTSKNYTINKTSVICNPLDYYPNTNSSFSREAIYLET